MDFSRIGDTCAPVQIPIRLSLESFGSISIAAPTYESMYYEPLSTRGCAFQEYLLSRRVLLFSRFELLWRCLTDDHVPVRCSYLHHTGLSMLPKEVFQVSAPALTKTERIWLWHRLVKEYSLRKLSKPIDRINALVGAVTELSDVRKDVYLMGLWSSTFVCDVGWLYVEPPGKAEESLAKVPTWSWLARDCKTQMVYLQVEDASIIPSPDQQPLVTNEDLLSHDTSIHFTSPSLGQVVF